MNEFRWRQQMHALRRDVPPQRDLWSVIEASLEAAPAAEPPPRRTHWLAGGALAASLLLAAGLGWQSMTSPPPRQVASSDAGSTWKPADPRLAGAAIELDAARMELQLALQQSPESRSLQRLLERTEQQQQQLQRLSARAG